MSLAQLRPSLYNSIIGLSPGPGPKQQKLFLQRPVFSFGQFLFRAFTFLGLFKIQMELTLVTLVIGSSFESAEIRFLMKLISL